MPDPFIQLGVDATGVDTGIDRVNEALRTLESTVKNAGQAILAYNFSSRNSVLTLKTLDQQLNQISTTYKLVNTAFEQQKVLVRENDNALKEHIKSIRELEKAQKFASTSAVSGQIKSVFPAPDNATIAQLVKYEQQITRIRQQIATGKFTEGDLSSVLGIAAGKATPRDLTTGQSGALSSLRTLQNAFRTTGISSQELANSIDASFNRIDNLISRFGIRIGLFAFVHALEQGAAQAVELDRKIGQLQTAAGNSGIGFRALSEQIRSLSDSTGLPQIDIANAGILIFQQRASSAAEATGLLSTSTKLAQVSLTSLNDSAKALVQTLEAYGLGNSEAEITAAKLNRTAELSHAKIDEIASANSRVASSGKALGVSFNEINAFLATLSQQGLNAGESASLLDAIFSKLLRPTDELKILFKELGVASGEQLIAANGFSGALDLIIKTAQGSSTNLDGLVGGIKELNAITGASANNFKDFKDNTDKIANSFENFNRAVSNASENIGEKVQKEFTRIKNFFISDLGGSILKTTDTMSGSVLNLSNGVKILTDGVIILGTAWGGYKLATLAASASTLLFSSNATVAGGSMLTLTGQATIATTAITRLRAALFGFGAIAGGLGLLVTTGPLILEQIFGKAQFSAESLDAIDRISKVSKSFTDEEIQQSEKRRNAIKSEFDERIKLVEKYITAAERIGTQVFEGLQRQEKTVSESLKLSSASIIESSRLNLHELERQVSEARSGIERSQRQQETFKARLSEQSFQTGLQFERDPDRSISLVTSRIAQLKREVNQLEVEGTKASIEAARLKLEEIGKLQEERFKKQVALKEEAAKLGREPLETVTDSAGITRQLLRIDQSGFLNERARLTKEQIALEERYQSVLLKQEETGKRQIIVEKIKAKAIEDSVNNLINFNPFDENGKFKKQFQATKPEDSAKKALDELNRLEAASKKALGPDQFKQLLSGFADLGIPGITEKRKIIEKELTTFLDQENIKRKETDIRHQREITDEQLKEIQKRKATLSGESEGEIKKAIADIGALISKVNAPGPLTSLKVGGVKFFDTLGFSDDRKKDFLKFLTDYESSLTEINKKSKDLDKDSFNPEKVRAFKDAITASSDIFTKFTRAFPGIENSGLNVVQKGDVTGRGEVTSLQVLSDLKNIANTLSGNVRENEGLKQNEFDLNVKQNIIKNNLENLGETLKSIPELANEAINNLGKEAGNAIKPINSLTESIQNLIQALPNSKVSKANESLLNGDQVATNSSPFPDDTLRFHDGGVVPGFGSGDTVHALLEPGEVVLSNDLIARHAPTVRSLLKAGNVENNNSNVTYVGDIHVYATAGDSPQQTARETAYAIQRELRRGTLN